MAQAPHILSVILPPAHLHFDKWQLARYFLPKETPCTHGASVQVQHMYTNTTPFHSAAPITWKAISNAVVALHR